MVHLASIYPFSRASVQVTCSFLTWVCVFSELTFENPFHIPDTSSLPAGRHADVPPSFPGQSVACLFIPLSGFFCRTKCFSSKKSSLSIFPSMNCVFGVLAKNSLSNPLSQIFSTFSSKGLIVVSLIYVIAFELIFLRGVRCMLKFIFCIGISSYSITIY